MFSKKNNGYPNSKTEQKSFFKNQMKHLVFQVTIVIECFDFSLRVDGEVRTSLDPGAFRSCSLGVAAAA